MKCTHCHRQSDPRCSRCAKPMCWRHAYVDAKRSRIFVDGQPAWTSFELCRGCRNKEESE